MNSLNCINFSEVGKLGVDYNFQEKLLHSFNALQSDLEREVSKELPDRF